MGNNKYNEIGGVETSISARFTPWMGLTSTILRTEERLVDAHKAHQLAGIDWQVSTHLLSEFIDKPLADETALVIRNTDQAVLGVAGDGYTEIQNAEVANMAQAIIEFRPDAHVESAGALHHGKVVWNLLALDDQVRTLSAGDKHYRYMLVYTSHDGSRPFAVRFTNVRVQCQNTFSIALGEGSVLLHKVRHTKNALDYIREAHESVKQAINTFDLWDVEMERLINTPVSKSDNYAVIKAVLGEPSDSKAAMTRWDNVFDAIDREYNADFNANIRGTAWGTIMAVNGYELHSQTSRGQSKADKQFTHLLSGKFPLTAKAVYATNAL
jgi:phage/plasmid-like protein (TIGR03299 family)